jgi:hypothetical protein
MLRPSFPYVFRQVACARAMRIFAAFGVFRCHCLRRMAETMKRAVRLLLMPTVWGMLNV